MRPSSPISFNQRTKYTRILLLCTVIFMFIVALKTLLPVPEEETPNATIFIVTPTHKRLERLADMTRLSNTLQHIKNIHWVVVEDGRETVPAVERLLIRSGLPFTYLHTSTPSGMPVKGWVHRNLALRHIRDNFDNLEAVVYFADDDNSYDLRIFDKYIRKVERIGVWAVGLAGGAYVEAPRVEEDKVIGWNVRFAPNRTFATDMAGFAVNLREIRRVPTAGFNAECAKPWHHGPEPCFLSQFDLGWEDLQPFGYNEEPRDVLVWHIKTKATYVKGGTHGYVAEKLDDEYQ